MSVFKELNSAIGTYIGNEFSDYAVTLDGSWGSGKTHYIKNEFAVYLKKKHSKYKLLYVSLFGLSSTKEINQKLLVEVYPYLNNTAVKIAGSFAKSVLSSTASIDLNSIQNDGEIFKALTNLGKNKIIVFDDLERLSYNLLIETLGLINQLVEHDKVKVLILLNSQEIEDTIREDSATLELYKRYQEKIIRYRLAYDISFKRLSHSVLEKYKLPQDILNIIIQTFETGGYNNLRTLQFAADTSVTVWDTFNRINIKKKYREKILKLVFRFIASIILAYKHLGMSEEDMNRLAKWSITESNTLKFQDINWEEVVVPSHESSEEEKDILQQYSELFWNPVDDVKMMYYASIVDYILKGFWNKSAFKQEIGRLISYIKKSEERESEKCLNQLSSYLLIADNELADVVKKVISYTEKGEYKLTDYLAIYRRIKYILTLNFKGLDITPDSLQKIFVKGVKNCKDDTTYHDYFMEFMKVPKNEDQDEHEILNAIKERNTSTHKSKLSLSSSDNVKKIFEDPEGYHGQMYDKEYQPLPLYLGSDAKSFAKRYMDLSNSSKHYVNMIFKNLVNTMLPIQYFTAESEWAEKVKTEIFELIKNKENTISKLNANILNKNMDLYIESIKRFQ